MFLVIGSDDDPCCRIVYSQLRELGHNVCLTEEPFVGEFIFAWTLDTWNSESYLSGYQSLCIVDQAWQGVLVRGHGVPVDPNRWTLDDYRYMWSESQAALLGWLHTLPCPVVNRPTANLWFSHLRPPLMWQPHFAQAGLPTIAVQMTNDIAEARRFGERWQSRLTYFPLTSRSGYTIATDEQWSELARIMDYLPAALAEPLEEPSIFASVAEQDIFWSSDPQLPPRRLAALETGLHQLARSLSLATVQVELRRGTQGLCCVDVHMFPRFDVYNVDTQQALGTALVRLLIGNMPKEGVS